MSLDNSDLVFIELNLKHFPEKELDRKQLLALVEEINAWRELGKSPDAVGETIETLRYDLDLAKDELNDWARAEAQRLEP